MQNRLIVFPQTDQLLYLLNKDKGDDRIYVVFQDRASSIDRIILVEKDIGEDELNRLPKDMEVLCCHEEALYWVKLNGRKGWRYSFDDIILDHLTKISFKEYLMRKQIITAPFYIAESKDLQYPLVAKPSIGFGSIGVKRIENDDDLRNYNDEYERVIGDSSLKKYIDRYFCEEKNPYILEK